MLKDGTYTAWFKTPLGQGTGIVHLADGKLWGRDSIMLYDGSYQTDGDRFSATMTITRHTPGHATMFGIDDVELKLEGTALGKTAQYTATTDAVPGMVMEGTLIACQPPAASPAPRPVATFDASKLPKLPKLSSR
jgi:hypothetical protein